VGATQGPETHSPEIACQSQEGGVITTGGGFSTYNPLPSWQNDTVRAYFDSLGGDQVPSPGYNPNGRAYPDVSLIGVEYQTVVSGQVFPLFGTSTSAPVFGAMISLINAARAAQNLSSVGFINPTLWAHSSANAVRNPYNVTNFSAFHDVTSGHNKCMAYNKPDHQNAPCCASGFHAAPGWDPVTGLGSITFGNLSQILATEVIVPLFYTDDDGNDDGDGSDLMLIIVSALVGAVLGAVLIIGSVYTLCCMSGAPSQYSPTARTEVALTHYPDARTQSVQPQEQGLSPSAVSNPLYALPQHPRQQQAAGTFAAHPGETINV
jgi:hypothetical protein